MNSINSLREILAYLNTGKLLRVREVCKFWKQTIESWKSRFESLSLAHDPVHCPILPRYIHIFGSKTNVKIAPFYLQHLKTARFVITPSAILALIEANKELFEQIESIEVDTAIFNVTDVEGLATIVEYHGHKMKLLRIAVGEPMRCEYLVSKLKRYISPTCKIWIRVEKIEVTIFNLLSVFQNHMIVGVVDFYRTEHYAYEKLSGIKHPLEEIAVMNTLSMYTEEGTDSVLDYLLNYKHKDTLKSIIFRIYHTPTSPDDEKIFDFIDSLPNLENLELQWQESTGCAYYMHIRLRESLGRITSLVLLLNDKLEYSLRDKFSYITFPKLKSFIYKASSTHTKELVELLRVMPALYTLDLQIMAHVKDLQDIEIIFSATEAQLIRISNLSIMLIQHFESGPFILTLKAAVRTYDSYFLQYGDRIFVRRTVTHIQQEPVHVAKRMRTRSYDRSFK